MTSETTTKNSSVDIERAQKLFDKNILNKCAPYQGAHNARSAIQLAVSVIPFFLLIFAMYQCVKVSVWAVIPFSIITAGFVLRIFMIQHDCGHGSFFSKRWANDLVGCLCSVLTLIPYYYWRRQHALHHASNSHLDERGHGDMDILTVKEYQKQSLFGKIRYRLYRSPFVYLGLGPIFFFLVINRFAPDKKKSSKRDRMSVYVTNVVIALMLGVLFYSLNPVALAWTIGPVIYLSGIFGIWLFYVQHQFEHTYWEDEQEWSFVEAAIKGSSYLKLPRILQWFTASIGFHHIHHLAPSIPNYRLEDSYNENPEFQDVSVVTITSSFKDLFRCLWDEDQGRLISFSELRKIKSSPSMAEQASELAEEAIEAASNLGQAQQSNEA